MPRDGRESPESDVDPSAAAQHERPNDAQGSTPAEQRPDGVDHDREERSRDWSAATPVSEDVGDASDHDAEPDEGADASEDEAEDVSVPDDAPEPDDEPDGGRAEPGRAEESAGLGLDPDIVLPLVIAASAIGAALGGHAPTGNALADFVLSASFGAIVPWCARFAEERRLLFSGAFALFFTALQPLPAFLAAGALAPVLIVVNLPRIDEPTTSIARTLSGALVVHSALQFPTVEFAGSASLFAAVVLAPILDAGWRSLTPERLSLCRRIAVGLLVFCAIASVLTVITALSARGTVEDAIDKAEAGIDAIEAGDQDAAVELLRAAGDDFDSAADRLGGPLTWPSRIVPIAAQHSRALETAANQGSGLAATAVQTVTTADVDQIRGRNGEIDLDLVAQVDRELTNANDVLRRARAELAAVRTPWLLPLLDDRLAEVEVDLVDVLADIDLANHATRVLPRMLGAEGERQYLVLFVQPSESREFGGFVGAYALVRADQGRLSLFENGSIGRDFGFGEAEFEEIGAYPESYYGKLPFRFPQNLTSIADLGTIARAARELSPQWREDPDFEIHGVMTIDPEALGGFLQLTGPMTISGRDEPIEPENVADYLLREQYLEFPLVQFDERQDVLRELAANTFEELLSIDIPGPERLGAIFGPLARSDRLAFTTFDEDENAFLRRVLLDADMPIIGDDVQMLGVYNATSVASKLDAFSVRNMTYDVTVDPETGMAVGDLEVEMVNNASSDSPDYVLRALAQEDFTGDALEVGTNLTVLNLYTRAEVDGLTSPDGEFIKGERTPSLTYQHQMIGVEVPLETERHATAQLTEELAPGRYDLLVTAQPTAVIGTITVTVRPTDGWRIVTPTDLNADGSWTITQDLDVHRPYSVVFEPVR